MKSCYDQNSIVSDGDLQQDYRSLFDLHTTMQEKKNSNKLPFRLIREIVHTHRVELQNSKIEIIDETFYAFRECTSPRTKKYNASDLEINIVRPCGGNGGDSPAMPSLRLQMSEKDYHEPIRDRDKNWRITSQREILDLAGKELINPSQYPRLGAYGHEHDSSELFWSSGFQALIRNNKLSQSAVIISDTSCILSVNGLGITGRLFSTGSEGKMIVIEAFSLWNCEKYTVTLSTLELKKAFSFIPDLLKAGKKSELLRELCRMLYFEYTVVIPASDKTAWKEPIVKHIIHLDRVQDMPPGYPRTIEEMIRVPPKSPSNPESPFPIVTQVLRLGNIRRENGPMLRKQLAIQRRLEIELEERERYRKWLQTPVRRRDMVATKVAHLGGKIVVLSAYNFPLRPTSVIIKGHVLGECNNIFLNIGLANVRAILGIETTPSHWTMEAIKKYVRIILDMVRLNKHYGSCENFLSLYQTELKGVEISLNPLLTASTAMARCAVARKAAHLKMINQYLRYPCKSLNEQAGNNTPPLPELKLDSSFLSIEEKIDTPSILDSNPFFPSASSLGYSLLSKRKQNHISAILDNNFNASHCSCKPYRDIGKGLRLTSRCTKVGKTYVIYAIYASGFENFRGRRKKWTFTTAKTDFDDTSKADINDDTNVLNEDIESIKPQTSLENHGSLEESVDIMAEDISIPDNSEDDDDGSHDSRRSGGSDEVDELDQKMDFYENFLPDVKLTLEVYVPASQNPNDLMFSECVRIPGSCRYSIVFTKSDLYRMIADRDLIGHALQALYVRFAMEGSQTEVSEAENGWDHIGTMIMQLSRFEVRDSSVSTNLISKQEENARKINISAVGSPLHLNQEIKGKLQLTSFPQYPNGFISSISNVHNYFEENSSSGCLKQLKLSLNDPFVVLTWSTVLFQKSMKISSDSGFRPSSVLLHVTLWQQGECMGVVCVDQEMDAVYTAEPSPNVQRSQLAAFRFLSPFERMHNIVAFLTTELIYIDQQHDENIEHEPTVAGDKEELQEHESHKIILPTAEGSFANSTQRLQCKGKVMFSTGEHQVVIDDVMNTDYSATASDAILKATEKAQRLAEKKGKKT